ELRAAWAAVEDSWEDEAAHDRFLDRVVKSEQFAFGLQCYRAAARGDQVAERQLRRLARIAEVVSLRRKVEEPGPAGGYRRAAALLFALVLLAAVLGCVTALRFGDLQAPPARALGPPAPSSS